MNYIINLNNSCNNNCIFCFNLYDKNKKYKISEIKKEICFAKKNKADSLDFYGGEPFLYQDDLFEILDYASGLGFKSSIATNATFLNQNIAERLNQLGVTGIRTTLHGHNKVLHELVTKRPGSYKATLSGIQALINFFEGDITINIVVTKINLLYLKAIVSFIENMDPKNRVTIKIANLIFSGDAGVYSRLALPYITAQPYLNNICDYLESKGRDFYIEKFPVCVASKYAQHFVIEKKSDKEILYWPAICHACIYRKECVGLSINYLNYISFDANEVTMLNKYGY